MDPAEGRAVLIDAHGVESNTELLEALLVAQGNFEAPVKDCTNPHFGNRYSSLTAVIDAVRPALHAEGILLTQPPVAVDDAGVTILTRLTHCPSGQWTQCALTMPLPAKPDAQKVGSAITYGRRYALLALLGIAPEGDDDDGNTAAGRGERTPKEKRVRPELKSEAISLAREAAGEALAERTDEDVWALIKRKILKRGDDVDNETVLFLIDDARRTIDASSPAPWGGTAGGPEADTPARRRPDPTSPGAGEAETTDDPLGDAMARKLHGTRLNVRPRGWSPESRFENAVAAVSQSMSIPMAEAEKTFRAWLDERNMDRTHLADDVLWKDDLVPKLVSMNWVLSVKAAT